MPLQPPLIEKLVGLLFLLVQWGKKQHRASTWRARDSKIPFKYDKKLAMIETKWKGFFLSLWCKFIYFVHYPSIHL